MAALKSFEVFQVHVISLLLVAPGTRVELVTALDERVEALDRQVTDKGTEGQMRATERPMGFKGLGLRRPCEAM